MATKKSSTKKPARAASARAKQTKTTVTTKKKAAQKRDFMSFTPTLETLYWLVLGIVIIIFTVWIMQLQANIQNVYDQININNASSSINVPMHAKQPKK